MARFMITTTAPHLSGALALSLIGAVPAHAQDGLVGADYPAAKYAASSNASRFDGADVDGDGFVDFVSATRQNPQAPATVLFGRGDGTFEPVVRVEIPVRPEDAAAVDLDMDGDAELVIISRSGGEVYVAMNTDGRTFAAPVLVSTAPGARDVELVDVNGDGFTDVLVGRTGPAEIQVLLSDGTGALSPGAPLAVGRVPVTIEVGDVDGDGRDDVLVADFIGDAFDLLRGTAGGFASAEVIEVGPTVRNPVLRDGTGDGQLDILFTEWSADGVFLMPGNGDGTFGAPIRTEAGPEPQSVEVADLDGDGAPEFIVTRESTFSQLGGRLTIIAGDPMTVFGESGPGLRTGSNPRDTWTGDLDGDGALDVAVLNTIGGDIAVLRGLGNGNLQVPLALDVDPSQPEAVVSGDFNGDGFEDLVICDGESGSIQLLFGDGLGAFTAGAVSDTEVECFAARAADLDGDGDLDVLVQGRRGGAAGQIAVALNDGRGLFTVSDRLPHEQETARQLEVGDLDGDGVLDIVTTGFFSRLVNWIGQGDGTFLAGPGSTGFEAARAFDLADVNGDGWLDAVGLDANDGRIDAYLGDGTGLLTRTDGGMIGPFLTSQLRLGDVDGDGALDAVLNTSTFSDENGVAVYRGTGAGTFEFLAAAPIRREATGLRVVDIDLDGRDEVVAVSSTAVSDVEVVDIGLGGAESRSVLYSGSRDASALAVGDFNDDGNPDLAISSPDAREITVLLHRADLRLNSYCEPSVNSTGARARLTADGSRSLAVNDLTLMARQMPPGELVVWFAGGAEGLRPLMQANLCIAGPLQRISPPLPVDPSGGASLPMAFTPLALVPGDTWYFQAWFMDPAGAAPQFNFSDGLAVRLLP